MTQDDTIQGGQQPDLEAAVHVPAAAYLPSNLTTNVSASSAIERVQPNNQPRSRLQGGKKDVPNPKVSQDATLFENFQQESEDSQHRHCLFFCWEDGANGQRAMPLRIEYTEDEARIYQELGQVWYKRHGWWWRYIPFCGVLGVEEIKFRFVRKHDKDYVVLVEKLDIPRMKEALMKEVDKARSWIPEETQCWENTSNGNWVHESPECATYIEPDFTCSFELLKERKRKLNLLSSLSLPLLCFKDPQNAAGQRTLEGIAQQSCIYKTSNIRGNSLFKPRIVETEFRGLMICWGWTCKPLNVPAIALIVVVLWKASGSSWEAAFAAGSFLLMLGYSLLR